MKCIASLLAFLPAFVVSNHAGFDDSVGRRALISAYDISEPFAASTTGTSTFDITVGHNLASSDGTAVDLGPRVSFDVYNAASCPGGSDIAATESSAGGDVVTSSFVTTGTAMPYTTKLSVTLSTVTASVATVQKTFCTRIGLWNAARYTTGASMVTFEERVVTVTYYVDGTFATTFMLTAEAATDLVGGTESVTASAAPCSSPGSAGDQNLAACVVIQPSSIDWKVTNVLMKADLTSTGCTGATPSQFIYPAGISANQAELTTPFPSATATINFYFNTNPFTVVAGTTSTVHVCGVATLTNAVRRRLGKNGRALEETQEIEFVMEMEVEPQMIVESDESSAITFKSVFAGVAVGAAAMLV